MTRREVALLLCLLASLALVVTGVAHISDSAAFIVAGVGLAGIAMLSLTEVGS